MKKLSQLSHKDTNRLISGQSSVLFFWLDLLVGRRFSERDP